jgi:long-chain fatty acid transport protein
MLGRPAAKESGLNKVFRLADQGDHCVMNIKSVLASLTLVLLTSKAFAVGVDSQKLGVRNYGTGGGVGIAGDPSAIAYNPAGLTGIENGTIEWEISCLFAVLNVYAEQPDGSQQYSRTFPVVPLGFIAGSRGDFAFGLGLYAPTGLGGVEFVNVPMDQLGGAAASFEGTQGGIAIAPAIAYRLSERLSLGLTAELYYTLGSGSLKAPSINADAEYETSGFISGYNLKLGIFANITEDFDMGFQVKTPATLKSDGKIREKAGALAGNEYDYRDRQEIPWYFIAGFAYRLSRVLQINSDIGYRLWSRYEKTARTDDPGAGSFFAADTEKGTWHNTYTASIGLSYIASDILTFRTGVQWMPTAIRRADAVFYSTDKNILLWSMGPEIRISEALQLHIVEKYTRGFERALNDNGRGSYESWDVMIGITGSFGKRPE